MAKELIYLDQGPKRLDLFVTEALSAPEITRSQVKSWIEQQAVLVNGRPAQKAGHVLGPGDRILLDERLLSPVELEPYEFALEILHEDESLVVINKPPGLAVHPGAGNRRKTLVNALVHHFRGGLPETFAPANGPPEVRPGIVHRLDKDTSGVLVVAKTLPALQGLARQFAEHSVGRAYIALVFSTPRARRPVNTADSGTIDQPLGRHPTNRIEFDVREGGKRAVTHWKVVERFSYGCLLEVRLETGRTHQIRVHMDHISSPVIGDRDYGDFSGLPAPLKREQEAFGRQALHARLLEFVHPCDARCMSFTSEPPQDMKDLIASFRSYR